MNLGLIGAIDEMEKHTWRKKLVDEEVTLRGILIPDELDEQFNVISLMLSTDDETEYKIVNNPVEKELYVYLREAIQVVGTVRAKRGSKHLYVKSYRILSHL